MHARAHPAGHIDLYYIFVHIDLYYIFVQVHAYKKEQRAGHSHIGYWTTSGRMAPSVKFLKDPARWVRQFSMLFILNFSIITVHGRKSMTTIWCEGGGGY